MGSETPPNYREQGMCYCCVYGSHYLCNPYDFRCLKYMDATVSEYGTCDEYVVAPKEEVSQDGTFAYP
jgi:hypothetical protein